MDEIKALSTNDYKKITIYCKKGLTWGSDLLSKDSYWTASQDTKIECSVKHQYEDFDGILSNSQTVKNIADTAEKVMTGASLLDSVGDFINGKKSADKNTTLEASTAENIPSFISKYAFFPIWKGSDTSISNTVEVYFRFGNDTRTMEEKMKDAKNLFTTFAMNFSDNTAKTPMPNQNTVTAKMFHYLLNDKDDKGIDIKSLLSDVADNSKNVSKNISIIENASTSEDNSDKNQKKYDKSMNELATNTSMDALFKELTLITSSVYTAYDKAVIASLSGEGFLWIEVGTHWHLGPYVPKKVSAKFDYSQVVKEGNKVYPIGITISLEDMAFIGIPSQENMITNMWDADITQYIYIDNKVKQS